MSTAIPMTYLITGATGMLGADLQSVLAQAVEVTYLDCPGFTRSPLEGRLVLLRRDAD